MNVDALKVIEKLQSLIAQQVVQIAVLQVKVDELDAQMQQLQEHVQIKE